MGRARRVMGGVGVLLMAGATGGEAQPGPSWFRGGAAPHGVADTRGVDALGGVAWAFRADGPVRDGPTLVEGVLYVGSRAGTLYALDAESGRARWSHAAGAPVGGAPLVMADRVIFTTRENAVHAVDRRTGAALWSVRHGADLPLAWGHEGWDYLLPSPVLADGVVLVGSGDGHLYALDPADGMERWRFRTDGRVRSAPDVADGVAYFGSGDGFVYGVDVRDGREVWRFETEGVAMDAAAFGFDRTQIQGSPVVADGVLYVGSRDASMYAVDLATREPRWTFEDGTAWVVNSPALAGGTLFSGRSSGGRFRAIDAATGQERWVHATGGLVFSSPTVVGSTVYVGSGSGRVWALDTETGAPRWSFATGGIVTSSPVVWEGRLYVGSDDGHVYALRAAEGPAPRLAVYWDDAMRSRSFFGGQDEHRRLADWFTGRGYELLDSAGLPAFLEARSADGAPSVVVFGMDGVPTSVVDPEDRPGSLLRRYLEAGGKAVWPGIPPGMLEFDAEGRAVAIERANPEAVLGVSFEGWDTDDYPVTVTDVGRRWGLATSFVGRPSVTVDQATEVLALDETGRAAAWVRSYGGATGTGLVVVPPTSDPGRLAEMRLVAEHGIFRTPR